MWLYVQSVEYHTLVPIKSLQILNGSQSAETGILVEILTMLYISLFENGFHQGKTEKSKYCLHLLIFHLCKWKSLGWLVS